MAHHWSRLRETVLLSDLIVLKPDLTSPSVGRISFLFVQYRLGLHRCLQFIGI